MLSSDFATVFFLSKFISLWAINFVILIACTNYFGKKASIY